MATFLFTDVEGSTRVWDEHPEAMRAALIRHDVLIERLVDQHEGVLVRPRGEGDSRFAVFADPGYAVEAACAIQLALHNEPWSLPQPLRVRLALHTGEADLRDGDYYGSTVNRCARLRGVAHGGQSLLSGTTAALVRDRLPPELALRGLGSHRLRDLAEPEHVFQLVSAQLPAEFPPLKSLSTLLHNLPIQPTHFIGRERDIADLKTHLATTRLLTLTGVGGVGKTRLALQLAAEMLDAFPDGVWMVELAALADPALVPRTVAAVLGVHEQSQESLTTTLRDAIAARQLLLVLDNCEHLVEACARLAADLLHACPHLHILATSREVLTAGGEVVWRVPSLSVPAAPSVTPDEVTTSDAGRLFVDRATAASPTFALTDASATAIAHVCRRLDGLPLAIELAAARVRVLSVEQIAARLDQRFRLLTNGSRVAPSRQQTLRATVDWSYRLLSPSEQALFDRLGVFVGDFHLEAAEAVGAGAEIEPWEVLDLLTRLIDKSLVQASDDAGAMRYRLLETIRQFAQQRLQESDYAEDTRRRHANHFILLVEDAKPELLGPQAPMWLGQLEAEYDNVRAALGWTLQACDAELALRFAGSLGGFWSMRGHFAEGLDWAERALGLGQGSPGARASALWAAGTMSCRLHEWGRAAAYHEAAAAMFREAGDPHGTALALQSRAMNLGGLAIETTHGEALLAEGDAVVEEALVLYRELGDVAGVAAALSIRGFLAREAGDLERAADTYEEARALQFRAGDAAHAGATLCNLGQVRLKQGRTDLARVALEEGLVTGKRLGDRRIIAMCLVGLACVEMAVRDADRAARLLGAADAVQEYLGIPFDPDDRREYARTATAARAALGEQAFTAAHARGREFSQQQAIALALASE